jgi:hypothetical protein
MALQKIGVDVIGPCSQSVVGYIDDTYKQIEITIEFAYGDSQDYTPETHRFILRAYRSTYNHGETYTDTWISAMRYDTLSIGMDEGDLAHAHKALKSLNAFIRKQTIQPRTVEEFLAVIMAYSKMKELTWFTYYPSYKQGSSIHEKNVSFDRARYIVRQKEEELNKLPSKKEEAA